MHGPDAVVAGLALGDEDGGGAARAAAEREGGVADADAGVAGHDGHEAQGFVEEVFEVFHVFDLVVGGRVAREVGRVDFVAEFAVDVGSAGEDVPGVGEEAGGGVAPGEEDVEELGAEGVAVAGLGEEGVEEDVAGFAVGGGVGGGFFEVA